MRKLDALNLVQSHQEELQKLGVKSLNLFGSVARCSIHIDIKNEKIWLQTNNTELDIGQDLITMGVPKEDSVIGFQPPYMRSFSGYAIA